MTVNTSAPTPARQNDYICQQGRGSLGSLQLGSSFSPNIAWPQFLSLASCTEAFSWELSKHPDFQTSPFPYSDMCKGAHTHTHTQCLFSGCGKGQITCLWKVLGRL